MQRVDICVISMETVAGGQHTEWGGWVGVDKRAREGKLGGRKQKQKREPS